MSLLPEQHLSDEAVAAFADGALAGHARERAQRHTAACAECRYAVAVQREAVWALRAAPAPALPAGLLDRLRHVPVSTPIHAAETSIAADGSAMFATFAMPAAALVPPARAHRHDSTAAHLRPFALAVAVVGALSAVAASATPDDNDTTGRPGVVTVRHGAPAARPAVDLLNAAVPIGR